MNIPKLYYSPGMTADEIIYWNVYIGHITPAQARRIMASERRFQRATDR